MKKTLLSAVLVLLFVFSPTLIYATVVNPPSNNYSFTMPGEWSEIPQGDILIFAKKAAETLKIEPQEYTFGAHLTGRNYFEYPYLLVQEKSIPAMSYPELEKVFKIDTNDKISNQFEGHMEDLQISKPVLDKERNIIFITQQADIGTVKMKGYTAIFIGKEQMVSLNFYSTAEEYDKWIGDFTKTVNTFRFNPGMSMIH